MSYDINPNIIALALSVAGTGATWLWHKISGDKKQSASELLDNIVGNLAHEWLSKYTTDSPLPQYLNATRDGIEKEIWRVAAKRGLQKTTANQKLVHGAIEKGTNWLASEISKRVPKRVVVK